MITAYIAIGSNLNHPVKQAKQAIKALEEHADINVIRCSSLYSSQPMGPQEQPDYINAVIEIQTELTPIELLDSTQLIEQQQGRVRNGERWGPRTLDLDILLYGNQCIESSRLTVPHYGMRSREFVIYPLYEIAVDLILPDNTPLKEIVSSLDKNHLSVWDEQIK